MPRFSAKAKEIHDEIRYNTNIVNANKLLEGLKDPRSICSAPEF
ncbi:MAG: hypothetical protein HeimC2_24130 [Candidatus Heimdallarchaeota archaeon LC_2]|nr:MAG: hypothetical protein HeimC2_24130 [Candidatus Heimdallarchaeota archaeon LC_2]